MGWTEAAAPALQDGNYCRPAECGPRPGPLHRELRKCKSCSTASPHHEPRKGPLFNSFPATYRGLVTCCVRRLSRPSATAACRMIGTFDYLAILRPEDGHFTVLIRHTSRVAHPPFPFEDVTVTGTSAKSATPCAPSVAGAAAAQRRRGAGRVAAAGAARAPLRGPPAAADQLALGPDRRRRLSH